MASQVPVAHRPAASKSFYLVLCSSYLTARLASGGTDFHQFGLHVRGAIAQCRIIAFHLDALTSQLEYVDNCRKHRLPAILKDTLYLSRLTVDTKRSHFLRSHHALDVVATLFAVHHPKRITRVLSTQVLIKGTLYRQGRNFL